MTFKDIRILLCDDSIFARKKIRDYLLTLNLAEIIEASDGQEAIDLYKIHRPHIVLMDIIMPKKTGIEALSEIISFDSKAKIVIVSSVGTQSHVKNAINAGAFEFLQKPVEESDIRHIIENVIRED